MGLFSSIGDFVSNIFGGEQKSKAEGGISQAGSRAYEAGAMSEAEKKQYEESFNLGNILKQILQYQVGVGTAPSGYQDATQQYLQSGGELGNLLYQQTLKEAYDPYAYYESTLQPQLQQAEDYINRRAQERGLIRSGIPIEQMGRAGVELAIAEADKRMQARSDALSRAAGLTQYMQQGQQSNLSNLSNLYGQQQQYGLQAKGTQAQSAANAAQYWAYPYQASLGDVYGRKQAMYALPGQLLQTGGTLAAASILGCWVAKEIFGSWEHPKTVKARYYINNLAPIWFKEFYLANGEKIANFIHNKPLLKALLRPMFECFAVLGGDCRGIVRPI